MKMEKILNDYFKDKSVLITGASSGIGLAFAHFCLQADAHVIASGRSVQKLNQLKKSVVNSSKLQTIAIDLNKKDSVAKLFASLEYCEHLDIVIHCAGFSFRGDSIQTQVYQNVMQVNFFAATELFRLAYPLLQKRQGAFAAVVSMQGLFAIPHRAPYVAAKHALHGYLNGVRLESWTDAIHVMGIYPGYVNTPGSASAITEDGSVYGKLDKHRSKGLAPEFVALEIAKGFYFKKRQIFPAGVKEKTAYFFSRFFPYLFDEFFYKKK